MHSITWVSQRLTIRSLTFNLPSALPVRPSFQMIRIEQFFGRGRSYPLATTKYIIVWGLCDAKGSVHAKPLVSRVVSCLFIYDSINLGANTHKPRPKKCVGFRYVSANEGDTKGRNIKGWTRRRLRKYHEGYLRVRMEALARKGVEDLVTWDPLTINGLERRRRT